MAQGAHKAKAKAKGTPSNKKTFGSRVIKPKKAKFIKKSLLQKVRSPISPPPPPGPITRLDRKGTRH